MFVERTELAYDPQGNPASTMIAFEFAGVETSSYVINADGSVEMSAVPAGTQMVPFHAILDARRRWQAWLGRAREVFGLPGSAMPVSEYKVEVKRQADWVRIETEVTDVFTQVSDFHMTTGLFALSERQGSTVAMWGDFLLFDRHFSRIETIYREERLPLYVPEGATLTPSPFKP